MVPAAYRARRSVLSKQIDLTNLWDPNRNMSLQ